jgi:hypothetical protein
MRKRLSLTEKIQKRIHSRGEGAIFVSRDFLDLGTRGAVDQALSRLAREGMIRRIGRGVYDVPRVSERLGVPLSPAPDAVAAAVAKSTASRFQVSGAQAANALGLSTQVPARVIYLTDGTPREIKLGNQVLEFRHAAPRSMRIAGRVSGTVIQALRHLGKQHITPEVIRHLRTTLGKREKTALRRDRAYAPGWMQPFLEEIVAEEKG